MTSRPSDKLIVLILQLNCKCIFVPINAWLDYASSVDALIICVMEVQYSFKVVFPVAFFLKAIHFLVDPYLHDAAPIGLPITILITNIIN